MRDAVMAPLRVMAYSTYNAWADMWTMYTPTGWVFGWVSRVVIQVIFFTVVGLLLDSPDALRFLFIGSSVMVTAMEALAGVASSTWERRQGTMPLLVAAPSRLWPVFVGRSVQWIPSGVLTSSLALFGLGPLFGLFWTPAKGIAAFLLLVVASITTYFVTLTLAALVLAAMTLRNVVRNIAQAVMMMICGVLVPVSFWPEWVQTIAQALPLTHVLGAVRALAESPNVPIARVASGAFLALTVGAIWLIVAALLLERLASAGSRSGSIEFAD